jgi:hypothetical protein
VVCIFALAAWLSTLLVHPTIARAQQSRTNLPLQPQALNTAGIYEVRQAEPQLVGSGVKFAVICRSSTYINGEPQNDYQPNFHHNCFADTRFTFHDQGQPPAGFSPHSTALCSILLGRDPNAYNEALGQFYYQSAAPAASADVYEFWHFLTNNVFPASPPDADIVTFSIGSQFEDWWTRGIDAMAEQDGLLVIAAIGNGSKASDPPLYPAAGANAVAVGLAISVNADNPATELSNFALASPAYSTAGPTADGRCKPDIIAPGNCLAADDNEPNSYKPTGDFSSFSTPIVAGAAALLVQKAKLDPSLAPAVAKEGGNCVIKAVLLNSATKLPFWHKGHLSKDDDHTVPLDYMQGAGMLNAADAYNLLTAGQNPPGDVPAASAGRLTAGWDNNIIGSDSAKATPDKAEKNSQGVYKFSVAHAERKSITATLVWNRHYEESYPFKPSAKEDADLRLELWAVDTSNPDNSYLLDYSDSPLDNVEHIYSQTDPNYTNYEIIVSYSGDEDPNQVRPAQRYGFAWSVADKPDRNNIFWYDLNTDGIVNELDFRAMLDNWFTSVESPDRYVLGDINADGAIDVNDFAALFERTNTRAEWFAETSQTN